MIINLMNNKFSIEEGPCNKGGQNIPAPGELNRRPLAPGGSGGFTNFEVSTKCDTETIEDITGNTFFVARGPGETIVTLEYNVENKKTKETWKSINVPIKIINMLVDIWDKSPTINETKKIGSYVFYLTNIEQTTTI